MRKCSKEPLGGWPKFGDALGGDKDLSWGSPSPYIIRKTRKILVSSKSSRKFPRLPDLVARNKRRSLRKMSAPSKRS